MTFEAVPPALLPTSTIPTVYSGGKPITIEIRKADKGIIIYWRSTPIIRIAGDLKTALKLDHFNVIPMPNMTTVSKGTMLDFSLEKRSGKKHAVTDRRIAHKGNNFVTHWSIVKRFSPSGHYLRNIDPALPLHQPTIPPVAVVS